MRHQLLVVPEADGHHGVQEVNELERVRPVAKEKVHALVDVLDVDALSVGAVLQDQLLQEQKGALVVHVLAELQRQAGRGRGWCRELDAAGVAVGVGALAAAGGGGQVWPGCG